MAQILRFTEGAAETQRCPCQGEAVDDCRLHIEALCPISTAVMCISG